MRDTFAAQEFRSQCLFPADPDDALGAGVEDIIIKLVLVLLQIHKDLHPLPLFRIS